MCRRVRLGPRVHRGRLLRVDASALNDGWSRLVTTALRFGARADAVDGKTSVIGALEHEIELQGSSRTVRFRARYGSTMLWKR